MRGSMLALIGCFVNETILSLATAPRPWAVCHIAKSKHTAEKNLGN